MYMGLPVGPTDAEAAEHDRQVAARTGIGPHMSVRLPCVRHDEADMPHNEKGFGLTRAAFLAAQRLHGQYQLQALNQIMKSELGCFASWECKITSAVVNFGQAKQVLEGTECREGCTTIPWARMATKVNKRLPAVNKLFSLHSCSCFEAVGLCLPEDDSVGCVPADECHGSWDLYAWAYPSGTRKSFWEWMRLIAGLTQQSLVHVEHQLCKIKCALLGSRPYRAPAPGLLNLKERLCDVGCASRADDASPAEGGNTEVSSGSPAPRENKVHLPPRMACIQ